jgi:dihydrodipicolinate synthase/N-acetylneuraminate lyase
MSLDRYSVDWRGYIPAVTTPFAADGELELDRFGELLDWMVAEGMHGVAVAGTTGEWFSMSPAERCALFAAAAERLRGRITLLAGCSAFTPAESIGYAKAARECGCDGILLTAPPYVVPNGREVVAYFRAVSDAVAIPICVYNWPRGTGVDLSPELLAELAGIDNVVAIKNSTGDQGALLATLFSLRDRVRIFGVPANRLGVMLVEHAGADGTIGAGAVLGSNHPDFFNHVWAGETEQALACGARDRTLFESFWQPDFTPRFGSQFAILKAALDLRGLPGGHVRPPLLPLTEAEREAVRSVLVELGVPVVAA